jgi:hypothetical protein
MDNFNAGKVNLDQFLQQFSLIYSADERIKGEEPSVRIPIQMG